MLEMIQMMKVAGLTYDQLEASNLIAKPKKINEKKNLTKKLK